MAILIGTFALEEMWDGYEKGVDQSRGPWVTKLYSTAAWDQTNAICNAFMGAGVGCPHRCPEALNLVCQSARVVGEGAIDDHAGGRPRFRAAVIEATYAIPPWGSFADEQVPSFPNDYGGAEVYLEQDIQWDTEVLKLPDTAFGFANSDQVLDFPVFRTIAVAEFVVTRKFRATIPYANMAAYLGKLNKDTLFGQPKGQLKLRKAGARRSFAEDGTRTQDQTWTFQWREVDHNKFMHPVDGQFYPVVDKSGNNVYQYADIGAVLRDAVPTS